MTGESKPSVMDDPLQAALQEAENLMGELGTTPTDQVIQGFSIDSDEEDANEDVPLDGDDKNLDFHPLHEDFLQQTAATAPLPVPQQAPPPQAVTAPMTTTPNQTPPSSGLPTAQPLPNGNHALPSMASPALHSAATPSLDSLKAQTSRFASNLANMAQRGLTQVASAAAVATTPTTSTVTHSNSPFVGGGIPARSGSITQPQNLSPSQAMVPVELDNEQKATLVHTHVGELLPGERVIMFLSNLLHVSDSTGFSYSHAAQPSVLWCCAMTYYRLILFGTAHSQENSRRPSDWNAACWPGGQKSGNILLQMPLASMDRVEKSVFSSSSPGSGVVNPTTLMGLLIHGKDNGRQLRFTTPSYADTLRAHEALQTYAFPGRRNLGYLFAFESKRDAVMGSIVTEEGTGNKTVSLEPVRKRFDSVTEFQRQMKAKTPWAVWTTINQSYQTCMSYPSVMVGPASLDESKPEAQHIIRQCAAFRSENRLPALTWTSGVDGASLWRCSQPKIGLQGNRSSADELFLKHITESASAANALADHTPLSRSLIVQLTGSPEVWVPEPGCLLKILDLRPRSAAMANRTGGYGYENTSNYPGTTLQFCNIGNVHAVRDSYQKMSALCLSPTASDVQWNAAVEDTKWLSHIRLILAASWETAFWIHVHRLPVLLHCSHGWDRTSQVAVLAQLLLDPYYRTREGFSTLVEKDFLSFGHPFHTRCSHGEGRGETVGNGSSSSNDEGQISPIFVQLLDCVFQIVRQYPECFEFNTKYLLIMSEHIYSCRFGNFLCDTEREREMVAGIRQRTHSLWDYLDSREDTLNPSYSAETASGVLLMPLPTLLRNVTLWSERHCMHSPKATLRWLPAGVQRPDDPLAGDQQSALITVQENQLLIMAGAAIAAKEKSNQETEKTFTIDDKE